MSDLENGMSAEYASQSRNSSSSSNRKKVLWIVVAVAALSGTVLGLGFGLSGGQGSEPPKNVNDNDSLVNNEAANENNKDSTSNSIPSTSNTARLASISSESVGQTYASCDALKVDLKILARMVGQRTINGSSWYFTELPNDDDMAVSFDTGSNVARSEGTAAKVAAKDATSISTLSLTASSFGTNNQVFGVEEADIVQSNGQKIFAAYGSEIIELEATTTTITRRTQVNPAMEGCSTLIHSMLLVEEKLVALTTTYCLESFETLVPTEGTLAPSQTVAPEITFTTTDFRVSSSESTSVLVYNTVNMNLLSNETLVGTYISARAIGTDLHVVTTSGFDFYPLTQFVEPFMMEADLGYKLNETEYKKLATAELEKRLDTFVAQFASELDCTSVQKIALMQNINDDLGFANQLEMMATVTSFAVSSPSSKTVKQIFVPLGGLQVYSSMQRLVFAIQGWWMDSLLKEETYLISYKYQNASISAPSLGTVPGYVMSQFSMDSTNQNGIEYLRVASTTQATWTTNSDGIWEESTDSTSQLTVLELSDVGQMPVTGQLTGLGSAGEMIYSVRFMGNKGVAITTNEQTRFVTLDLSDPTDPKAAGELAKTAASTYLHPVGENMILGIGQGDDGNGTMSGIQISLFDVSTLADPILLQSYVEVASQDSGSTVSSSSSDAQYNHNAFRYFDDEQLLIIPVSRTEYTSYPCPLYDSNITSPFADDDMWSNATVDNLNLSTASPGQRGECFNLTGGNDGFIVYKIDPSMGISEYFSIDHASGADYANQFCGAAYLQGRSLIFSGDITTMKGHTVLSHDLTTRQENGVPLTLDTTVEKCNNMWM